MEYVVGYLAELQDHILFRVIIHGQLEVFDTWFLHAPVEIKHVCTTAFVIVWCLVAQHKHPFSITLFETLPNTATRCGWFELHPLLIFALGHEHFNALRPLHLAVSLLNHAAHLLTQEFDVGSFIRRIP